MIQQWYSNNKLWYKNYLCSSIHKNFSRLEIILLRNIGVSHKHKSHDKLAWPFTLQRQRHGILTACHSSLLFYFDYAVLGLNYTGNCSLVTYRNTKFLLAPACRKPRPCHFIITLLQIAWFSQPLHHREWLMPMWVHHYCSYELAQAINKSCSPWSTQFQSVFVNMH